MRLNIFTPDFPKTKNFTLKPVIAYIGGEGLITGGSNTSKEGPEYLLDYDVVLVTINYRLGTLGFLSTLEVFGNNGFRDQVLALQWIRQNVISFGGNPKQVTLMGWAAGALSGMLHLISPLSAGLFHGLILMSGTFPFQHSPVYFDLTTVSRQAILFKCNTRFTDEQVKCLRKATAKRLGKSELFLKDKYDCPEYVHFPSYEPNFGQEAFMSSDPQRLLQNGSFSRVPIMLGYVQHELFELAARNIDDEDRKVRESATWVDDGSIAETCLAVGPKGKTLGKIFWENFLENRKYEEFFKNFGDLLSQANVQWGVHRFITMVGKFTEVYHYKNTYVSGYRNFKREGSGKCEFVLFLNEQNFVSNIIQLKTPFEEMTRFTFSKMSHFHQSQPSINHTLKKF